MSRTIAHRELRNNSAAVLREVQHGETLKITNHGKVVAVLAPPGNASREGCARESLVQGGFSTLPLVDLLLATQDVLDDLRDER